MNRTLILEHHQIALKLKRIAWQIYEDNHHHKELLFIGIRERGSIIANYLASELKSIASIKIQSKTLHLDPENPFLTKIPNDVLEEIKKKHIVIIDDVLNSGKSLAAALMFCLQNNPLSVQTAILANRDHKKYPIFADYVGISLSTTLKEHISFEIDNNQIMTVYLD